MELKLQTLDDPTPGAPLNHTVASIPFVKIDPFACGLLGKDVFVKERLAASTLNELAFYRMTGSNDNSFARLFFILYNVAPGTSFQRRYLYADTTTTGTK